jgi:hypothetical protein
MDGSREKLGRNHDPIFLLVGEMPGRAEGGKRHIQTIVANPAIQ